VHYRAGCDIPALQVFQFHSPGGRTLIYLLFFTETDVLTIVFDSPVGA